MAVMAMPGLRNQVINADEDPLGRAGTGSVVGIHVEVAGMYTGTMIKDLMATVERAEQRTERQRIAEEQELQAIFAMQIPLTEGDQVFMGAA
jgi:hypothetical protein